MKLKLFAGAITLALILAWPAGQSARAATTSSIAPEFINFGYIQNNSILPYVQMEAFTHVAAPFVDFDANGNLLSGTVSGFKNRPGDLRLNGLADRTGTKVICVVRNNGFSESILNSVMQDATRRANLAQQVIALIAGDTYCAGVNFDFEFSWGSATRDGITQFLQLIRAGLPNHEVSVYTHAFYDSNKWNIPGIINYIDYLLYSTYDFGTSSAHAIADYDAVLREVKKYLDAGVPANKFVLTWVTYGRRFYKDAAEFPTINYNDGFGSQKQSLGFNDTLWDTTLRQNAGGPFAPTYVRGDETVYYKYTIPNGSGGNYNMIAVGDTPESLTMKISAARNFPGYNGVYGGLKLRGVGWWSMMWVSKYWQTYSLSSGGGAFSGFDPHTNSVVPRAPYYRHVDLLVQELLKQPGQSQFQLESFENANPHWRDPNTSPDTKGDTDSDSVFTWNPAPAGAGRPTDTAWAGRLKFDFESASANRAVVRYEMLNHMVETTIADTPSALALVTKNTRISGHYYVAGNYSARTIRYAAIDANRQIEVSPPVALPAAAGWYQFTWDLNDPAQVQPFVTAEPNLVSGNGVIDTAAPGARDVSFYGFMIEGGGAGSGDIYFDELKYENHAPAGKSYVINELRYGINSAEFVEISGPSGATPSGLQLITYNSADGSAYKSVPLNGRSIPASGILVMGDSGVPGATGASGFTPPNWSTTTADLPGNLPGAMQLYDSNTGYVYDSVVYGAYSGVNELSRIQTRGVTAEGYGWLGSLGSGTGTGSQRYSLGRMAFGADSNWNQRDFAFMDASPGQVNAPSPLIGTGQALNFESVPAGAFQTYQAIRLEDPTVAGLPASPAGGKVYRCVDTAGGGLIGVFGDGDMGDERGLDITGRIFIPASTDPAQAVAVGFCGRQGSTFFSDVVGSGYEDGYWLIYENKTVGLNDGQPDHPGSFQFVMATNDNIDPVRTTALAPLRSAASLNRPAGTWAAFRLRIDPAAAPAQQLTAQIDGTSIYSGPIPAGGATRGAFMVGFRETNDGVTAREGTWIDDLKIDYARPPSRVMDYELY